MSVKTEVDRIKTAKTNIATAIGGKGVTVPSGTKIDGLASLVSSIPTPNLQSKSATPSESAQTIKPDTNSGYNGLSQVTVGAISKTYVGSGVAKKSSSDLTASGKTVTVPAGYYASNATKDVSSGSAKTPDTTITANPSLSTTYTSGSGYKMSVSKTQSVTPTVSAGYVSSGTAGTITVSGSAYVPQSSTGSATSSTSATAARTIGYGQQTTIGAGYYPSDRIIRNSVSAGSATTPTTSITATNTVTIDANGKITATASGSKSITPTVSAGYVSSGTSGTVSVSGTGTKQLTVQAAKTVTPTTSEQQAVASGVYTTGAVKVAAVPTETKTVTPSENRQVISPSSGKFLSSVTVEEVPDKYIDTTVSSNAVGSGDIRAGKKAFVNKQLVTGDLPELDAGGTPVLFAPSTISEFDRGFDYDSSNNPHYYRTYPVSFLENVNPYGDDDVHAGEVITQEVSLKIYEEELGNATAANVLTGTTFTSCDGFAIDGEMPNASFTTSGNVVKTTSTGAGYVPANTTVGTVGTVSGSIGGSATSGKATAAISNVHNMNTLASTTGRTAGTDYFTVKATATGTAGGYTPKYTVNTAGYIGSTVTGTNQTVSVSGDSTGKSIHIPRAVFEVDGQTVKVRTGGYIPGNAIAGTVPGGGGIRPSNKSNVIVNITNESYSDLEVTYMRYNNGQLTEYTSALDYYNQMPFEIAEGTIFRITATVYEPWLYIVWVDTWGDGERYPQEYSGGLHWYDGNYQYFLAPFSSDGYYELDITLYDD